MRSMTEGAVGEAGGYRFTHRSHPRVSRRRVPGNPDCWRHGDTATNSIAAANRDSRHKAENDPA